MNTNIRWMATALSCVCLVLVSGCAYLPWHSAQPPVSADWCADAVLFSMHSVRSYEQGTSYSSLENDLDASDVSYRQLYPALSIADMHTLLNDVTTHHRPRFAAAQTVVQACNARNHAPAPDYAPAYLSSPHSDEWCGQATDFAMGMAGYRDIGFPEKQMEASVSLDPDWLKEVFPALEGPDETRLVQAVYTQGWSRYAAADALAHACKVSVSTAMQPPS